VDNRCWPCCIHVAFVYTNVSQAFLFHRPFFILNTSLSPPSSIKQTQGSIFWELYSKKSIHAMVPSLVWWMCLATFTKLWNIFMRYSCISPRVWINKQFLHYESIKVTAKVNSMIIYWRKLNVVVIERFCSLCVVFPPIAPLFTSVFLKIAPKAAILPIFKNN